MAEQTEMREKERRVRELMIEEGLAAVAVSGIGNFAWLTCGGSNYVGTATENGSATAIITPDAKYILCDNIEHRRILEEEVDGQDYEFRAYPWFDANKERVLAEITGGGTVGADVPIGRSQDVSAVFDKLRFSLTPQEIERYEWLGKNVGDSLTDAASRIAPGMTEHRIASILNAQLYERGILPAVTLIAVDDRISSFRHPLPTDKKLEKRAMLVTGARKWGLIVSASRLVHFGPLSDELRRKHNAVCRVDAAFIANTRPGAVVGEIFSQGVAAYEEAGYPGEWTLHHQGGPTGYKGREFRANAQSTAVVAANQAFAWNPSITGTKSEDTIIATPNGPRVISSSEGWPEVKVDIDSATLKRSDILVR